MSSAVFAFGLVGSLLYGIETATASAPAAGPQAHEIPAGTTDVTLVTGDRLTVDATGRVSVTDNPARKGIRFMSYQEKGSTYVLPSDAVPLIGAGRLDGQLFNVGKLAEFGYTTARGDLPLIVTGAASAKAAAARAGASVTHDLSAIDAVAVKSKHSKATQFWTEFKAGKSKLWLDSLYRTQLDQSVPHVGAPTAWAAGYDGTGVKVAVVDSGIDATHPDLTGKVIASANFTTEPDALDYAGHGTHVASTIAGSGAASSGANKGVAPGASLLNSKVCIAGGTCSVSAIIAGMQWAAQQGADVINMSLGGGDTPGVDPLEQAVNDLTASHGVLFVISSGNSQGLAGARSVSSPSTADAALSVAAMDLSDIVAPFSNRGPRVGDAALKPDIAAPGVAITAARSSTSPGSGSYVDFNGTSMAAPHVAGAAAILAQRRPTWTPAQLKSAIMTSSVPNPSQGVFTQGAGRLNVARTHSQFVTSSPASLSFGRQTWPHADDPVLTQTITFTNHHTDGIGLSLTVDARDANGNPAPAGMFTLSTNFVSMPAGTTGSVTLTVDTRIASPDGFYGGWVHGTGSGGATATSTAFGVDKGEEGYELTLNTIDRAGTQTQAYSTVILKSDLTFGMGMGGQAGPQTIFLRPGTYLVSTMVFDGPDTSVVMAPRVEMTQNRNIAMDARLAQPVNITVPDAAARHWTTDVGGQLSIGGINASVFNLAQQGNVYTAQVHSTTPVADFTGKIVRTLGIPGTAGDFRNSPKVWHIGRFFSQQLPTGHTRSVTAGELHTVTASHTRHVAGSVGDKGAFAQPGSGSFSSGGQTPMNSDLPFTWTEYFDTSQGLKWYSTLSDRVLPMDAVIAAFTSALTTYSAGGTSQQSWNRPVYGPSFAGPLGPAEWSVRGGNKMRFILPLFSDADGHAGFQGSVSVPSTGSLTLRQGSTVIGTVPYRTTDAPTFDVPAGWLPYQLEASVSRGAPVELSTQVSSVWNFTSDSVDPNAVLRLPLWTVGYRPTLNAQNAAPKNTSFQIPLTLAAQPGSPASTVRTITVEWSVNDGATWTAATVSTVGGNRVATIPHPNTTGFVSLRAYVDDWANNSATQTVIRAYRIA